MTSGTLDGLPESEVTAGLYKLAALPAWLLAPLQAKPVTAALRQAIPEFGSGALELKSCKIKRMLLKGDGHWAGTYALGIEGPEGKQSLALRGTFTPPALRAMPLPAATPDVPLGAEGWRLVLPNLALSLCPSRPKAS